MEYMNLCLKFAEMLDAQTELLMKEMDEEYGVKKVVSSGLGESQVCGDDGERDI